MAQRIVPASELRQNLREVLDAVEGTGEPCYVTQRSRPVAVIAGYEAYEAMTRKATRGADMKSALRWSLGFMANLSAVMETLDEPSKYVELLEAGASQGLERNNVPRGGLTTLDGAAELIKEWDHKSFRLHEGVQVLEHSSDSLVLGRASCPHLLDVMRKEAPFHIKRIGFRDYRGGAKESVEDFLCLCCGLCTAALVDWLSDGRFLVAEMPAARRKWKNTCVYAVRPKVRK